MCTVTSSWQRACHQYYSYVVRTIIWLFPFRRDFLKLFAAFRRTCYLHMGPYLRGASFNNKAFAPDGPLRNMVSLMITCQVQLSRGTLIRRSERRWLRSLRWTFQTTRCNRYQELASLGLVPIWAYFWWWWLQVSVHSFENANDRAPDC